MVKSIVADPDPDPHSGSGVRMFLDLPDPHPDPLVGGTDPRIRIRIRNAITNWYNAR